MIAEELGFTRQNAQQVEASALKKLRKIEFGREIAEVVLGIEPGKK